MPDGAAWATIDICAEDYSGDAIDEAVYQRNMAVYKNPDQWNPGHPEGCRY